jgi:hypothetical protein
MQQCSTQAATMHPSRAGRSRHLRCPFVRYRSRQHRLVHLRVGQPLGLVQVTAHWQFAALACSMCRSADYGKLRCPYNRAPTRRTAGRGFGPGFRHDSEGNGDPEHPGPRLPEVAGIANSVFASGRSGSESGCGCQWGAKRKENGSSICQWARLGRGKATSDLDSPGQGRSTLPRLQRGL